MDPRIYDHLSTRQILKVHDKDLTRYFMYQNMYELLLDDFRLAKINNNYLMMMNSLNRIRLSPFFEKSIEYNIGYTAIESKIENSKDTIKCERLYKLYSKDIFKVLPECKNLNNEINISDILDILNYKLCNYKI